MSKLIYADLNRCIDCQACEVACQREHDSPSDVWVVRVEDRFAVPLACRHCEQAPCVTACYAEALSLTQEGTIAFDAAACTGCGLCLFACPFGVVGFDWDGKVIHKCDLCAARLAQAKSPACVVTCPTQALAYGEYETFTRGAKRRAALAMVRAMAPQLTLSLSKGQVEGPAES
jgi:formate dehydrogenase iron-sulfur subunit